MAPNLIDADTYQFAQSFNFRNPHNLLRFFCSAEFGFRYFTFSPFASTFKMFCNRCIFKSSHSLILLAHWIRCRTICQDYTKLGQNLFFKILGLLPKFLLSFILPSCQSTLDGCNKRLKYAKKDKYTNTQIHICFPLLHPSLLVN